MKTERHFFSKSLSSGGAPAILNSIPEGKIILGVDDKSLFSNSLAFSLFNGITVILAEILKERTITKTNKLFEWKKDEDGG